MDWKIEPAGVVTLLDVREQGEGLRTRANVLSLENCNKDCFISREIGKPNPVKDPLCQRGGVRLLVNFRSRQGCLDRGLPDRCRARYRCLCQPLGANERETGQGKNRHSGRIFKDSDRGRYWAGDRV